MSRERLYAAAGGALVALLTGLGGGSLYHTQAIGERDAVDSVHIETIVRLSEELSACREALDAG